MVDEPIMTLRLLENFLRNFNDCILCYRWLIGNRDSFIWVRRDTGEEIAAAATLERVVAEVWALANGWKEPE